MKVSVVITTYNWPEALNITLSSLQKQTVLPNEIIIADDGSGKATEDLIQDWQQKSKIPIVHSWQEDDGFRLAKSRNKAIAKTKGDYIIMVDGDLFLHKNFIKSHKDKANKNQFCVGTRVLLNDIISKKIINDVREASKLSFFSKDLLRNRKNILYLKLLSTIFSFKTKSYHKVRGANMAFWREDLLKVNGFNEDFVGWGREDTEIVVRLLNAGITRKNIKFCANVLHIYHKENSRKMLPENDKILQNTIDAKLTRCNNGIDKYLIGN